MAKICNNCGTVLRDEELFCVNCGARLDPAPQGDDLDVFAVGAPPQDPSGQGYYQPEQAAFQQDFYEEPPRKKGRTGSVVIRVLVIGLILAAAVGAGVYFLFFSGDDDSSKEASGKEKTEESTGEESESEDRESGGGQLSPDSIRLIAWDINFSQVSDLDTEPVDVLIKVENNGDKAVKSVDFNVIQSGTYFENRADGGRLFNAYGYVEPGETGFLYGQIEVPDGTPKKQGEIVIQDVTSGRAPEGYEMPYGKVTYFDKPSDTYDVEIYNPNDRDVEPGDAVVIAVIRGKDDLSGAWGAGEVNSTVPAGEETVLEGVIYDPGFTYKITEHEYSAFIIEKDVLGID